MANNTGGFSISGINRISPLSLNDTSKTNDSSSSEGVSFGEYLTNALNNVSGLQQDAKVAEQKLALGEIDDIHSVIIAAEKADLALQYTLAIRNKIVDAYQEIMRMQL